jgi:S-adenosylmethionine synthetase
MEIVVRTLATPPPGSQDVEIVERKGVGHPDSICDGIAEHVCVRLCRHYLDRFGVILHHNVDKILLCGGAALPEFGGGELLEPIEIYLAGRATASYDGIAIPVHDIAIHACREWLAAHLPRLDAERHVRIASRLRPGSGDLARLFARGTGRPLANDTSCGAGFAPLTDLERVVLAVERALNSPATKSAHPEIGEDAKVMGVRRNSRIELTISCAFIGRFIASLEEYIERKAAAVRLALEAARKTTALSVEAALNVADNPAGGEIFLTVTGTSAEAGDDGEAGRGNRVSGLITPYRVMTLESAAGKNPVTHVGKIYNLLAMRIASSIVTQMRIVDDAACVLTTQIGRPVDDPLLVDLRLATPADFSSLKASATDIVRAELERLPVLRDELLSERLPVY